MSAQTLPSIATEPDRSISFSKPIRCQEHVQDHVLASISEKWEQLLDSDLVQRCRSTTKTAQELEQLSQAYLNSTRVTIQEKVDGQSEHQHFLKVDIDEEGQWLPIQEILFLWCSERKLFIVCKKEHPVSGAHANYRISTAYRKNVNADPTKFNKKMMRSIDNKVVAKSLNLTADHSGV